MINLLPQNAEQQLKSLYRYRLATTLSLLCGAVALATLCMLLPSYVLLQSQVRAYEETSLAIKEEQADVEALSEKIKAANLLSEEIATYDSVFVFSEVAEKVAEIAGERIALEVISFEEKPDTPSSVVVSGRAATRNDLTAFSSRLIADPMFVSADVPIQNLAGDRDVSFTITIVLETTQ
jgi:Tfp pilus assembly protein PilN